LTACDLVITTAQVVTMTIWGCSQSKVLLHVSLLVQDGANTSLWFSASYTGYHCASVSSLSWPTSFFRRWPGKSWCILLITTISYRTQTNDICAVLIPERVLSHGQNPFWWQSCSAAGLHNSLPAALRAPSLNLQWFSNKLKSQLFTAYFH